MPSYATSGPMATPALTKADSTILDGVTSRFLSQVARLRDTNGHAERTLDRLFGALPAEAQNDKMNLPVATLDLLDALIDELTRELERTETIHRRFGQL